MVEKLEQQLKIWKERQLEMKEQLEQIDLSNKKKKNRKKKAKLADDKEVAESEDEDAFLNSCIAKNAQMLAKKVAEKDELIQSKATEVIDVYKSRHQMLGKPECDQQANVYVFMYTMKFK